MTLSNVPQVTQPQPLVVASQPSMNTGSWGISGHDILMLAIPIIATIIIAVIAYLLKRAIDGLERTDARIEGKVDKIESFTHVAANSIVEIQTLLGGRGFTINQKLAYAPGSPIKLTEYGENLMKESNFYDTLGKDKKGFVDLVIAKNPQSNYDIQEFSRKVLKELSDSNSPLISSLKNYAYNKGLPLEILLNSAGIVLRDEVMKTKKFDDGTLDK